ncbi:MAG: transcriptional regulator [Steroidobacteraceae bacterium]|nr:transcriptional regulator [Steroidobacteraceae bacterium]
MPTPTLPSNAVRRALRKLGADIKDARRRRKLTTTVVAERAFTTRKSLQRVEQGDFAVSSGIYASVLLALGMLERLADLADPATDELGLALSAADLPQRVRTPKR